jgi:hypothetical protein
VAAALVAGYRPYVAGMVQLLGIDPTRIGPAIDRGATGLEESLARWAGQPPGEQHSTPMELFREALHGPTRALVALGVPPVERDEASRRSLPGDLFDLAPSSARDLGDDAWATVAAWGIARAAVIAGVVPATDAPRPGGVALVATDLMDRSKVAAASEAAGIELAVWRNPAAVEEGLAGPPPRIALVDLTHPAALDLIARIAGAGVPVVAYGPHVDAAALEAATAAGAGEALPRSRFFARLPRLLSPPA